MTSVDLRELESRFVALYTGAITDVLDRLGFLHQTLPSDITALRPGMKLAGPAYPIEGRPHPNPDYDTSVRAVLDMLGQVPAVIDGGCRDIELIVREDYPVFARYTTPQDCTYRWELVAHGDVTVTIGDVTVAPGDYVVADADGIVVIPDGLLLHVLEQAEAKVATENEVRDAVRAGTLPLAAYERFGTF